MATGTARITSFLTRVFYLSFLHFLTRDRENRTRFKQWPSQPFLLSFLSSLPFSFLNFRNSQTRLTNLAGSKLAGLGDPDRSILGHSHCFLASISPSLSVLFFRGNTHAITSFLTRPLYSLLPSSEAENRIGFQRWHEWPRNPSFPPSFFPPPPVFFLLCLSPISPAVLPLFLNFHGLFTASYVTKRANYFEAERARIDARFELIAGGFAKIYDKNMHSYRDMIMPITFVISNVGGNSIIETREIFWRSNKIVPILFTDTVYRRQLQSE